MPLSHFPTKTADSIGAEIQDRPRPLGRDPRYATNAQEYERLKSVVIELAGLLSELEAAGAGPGGVKLPVQVVTTEDVDLGTGLAAGQEVNGRTLVLGWRVLVPAQDDATENGIWIVTATVPTRAPDLFTGTAAGGVLVVVQDGDESADSLWMCTNNLGADVVGTDELVFNQYPAAAAGPSDWKDSVRCRTTANVDLAGGGLAAGTTHDGVELAEGDRVLVMVQDDATENGILIAPASGAASRAEDLDTGANAASVVVPVEEGDDHADTEWQCTTDAVAAVVGTDQLTFEAFIEDECCAAMGAFVPNNWTPSAPTPVGQLEGLDAKLGELGAQSVTADPDGVLDAATGNEVAYKVEAEVDKATSGNWTGIEVDIAETSAPGADNRLLDLKVDGVTQLSVASDGSIRIANPASGVLIDNELSLVKGNLNATVAPTVDDDETLGYASGSRWVDTVGVAVYECIDPTEGAAVWLDLTGAGGSEFADDVFRIQDQADPTKEIAFQASGITAGQTRTITVPDADVDLTRASQSTVNTGTNATQAVTASTLANRSPRAPKVLNSAGVGAHTISDAAVQSDTGFKIRDDYSIDQQDASGDLMAYTIATAEIGSCFKVTVRSGQSATFTGSGVTVVAMAFPDGGTSDAAVNTGAVDRCVMGFFVTATRCELYGGDAL